MKVRVLREEKDEKKRRERARTEDEDASRRKTRVAAREKREEAGCCTRASRRLVLRVKWQRGGRKMSAEGENLSDSMREEAWRSYVREDPPG